MNQLQLRQLIIIKQEQQKIYNRVLYRQDYGSISQVLDRQINIAKFGILAKLVHIFIEISITILCNISENQYKFKNP